VAAISVAIPFVLFLLIRMILQERLLIFFREMTFSFFYFLILFGANICRNKTIYRSIFAVGQSVHAMHTQQYMHDVLDWRAVSVGSRDKLSSRDVGA
jgi:hypothetical protein